VCEWFKIARGRYRRKTEGVGVRRRVYYIPSIPESGTGIFRCIDVTATKGPCQPVVVG